MDQATSNGDDDDDDWCFTEQPAKVMKRSQRWNTLQICPHRGSNSGGSDMWSKNLPVRSEVPFPKVMRRSQRWDTLQNAHAEIWTQLFDICGCSLKRRANHAETFFINGVLCDLLCAFPVWCTIMYFCWFYTEKELPHILYLSSKRKKHQIIELRGWQSHSILSYLWQYLSDIALFLLISV